MLNAGDQRQVRKAKQRERLQREQELADLRHVLETRPGRRFVWRLLAQAGCFRLSFTYAEPETTVFNEGRRSLGLLLMAEIHELDPSFYMTMAKEARDEERRGKDVVEESPPVTEEQDDV